MANIKEGGKVTKDEKELAAKYLAKMQAEEAAEAGQMEDQGPVEGGEVSGPDGDPGDQQEAKTEEQALRPTEKPDTASEAPDKGSEPRTVDIGIEHCTGVVETGPGIYRIIHKAPNGEEPGFEPMLIGLQDGPVAEVGVNGAHVEDLIAIAIDRIKQYELTDFACHENKMALEGLFAALNMLNARTIDRRNRGVEGKKIL